MANDCKPAGTKTSWNESCAVFAAIKMRLPCHLGQESFVVLNRKDKGTKARRKIVFDDIAVLGDESVLPRKSKILMCFYQIQSGETERAFYSYLNGEGFKDILIASLFLDSRGKEELKRAGLKHVSAYDSVPDWGDTPWKLNDAWKWV